MRRAAWLLLGCLLVPGVGWAQSSASGGPSKATPTTGSVGCVSFANLAGLAGSMAGASQNCCDCKATTPCSGGGNGAFARRVASTWDCGESGGGGGGSQIPITANCVPTGNGTSIECVAGMTYDGSTLNAPDMSTACTPSSNDCRLVMPDDVGNPTAPSAASTTIYTKDESVWARAGTDTSPRRMPRIYSSGSCVGETTGQLGDICIAAGATYICVPTSGDCNDNTEWKQVTTATIATTTTSIPTTSSTSTSSTSTSSTSTSTSSTTSTTAGGTGTDYGSQDQTLWCALFEDSLTDGLADSCASNPQFTDCNPPVGPPTSDATNFKEQTHSGLFTRATPTFSCCGSGSCPTLFLDGSSQKITVGAWIRLASTGVRQEIVTHDGAQNGWLFRVTSGNKLEVQLAAQGAGCGGAYSIATGSTTLTTGTWYHVAFASDNTTLALYLNGVAETVTCSGTPGTTSGNGCTHTTGVCGASDPIQVGTSATSASNTLNGNIDEAFIRNDGLSATQICGICRKGLFGTTSDRDTACGSCTPS